MIEERGVALARLPRRRGTALAWIEPTDEQLADEAAREASDGPAFAAIVARHRGHDHFQPFQV
jgi:hypothetical protein